MKITIVEVEAHEKRAHPSEMGHWDSRVAYTLQVDEGDDPDKVVEWLQFRARQQVAVECDRWIEEIKTREAQDRARNDLHWIVERLENRLPDDRDVADFEKKIALLPSGEHPEWRAKLSAAQGEFLSRIKRDLDKIVERAGRKKVFERDAYDYDQLMLQLPESERQGYIDKMVEANAAYELSVAPQPAETAMQVENTGSGKEEVPF